MIQKMHYKPLYINWRQLSTNTGEKISKKQNEKMDFKEGRSKI
jgi:hypothetical protein